MNDQIILNQLRELKNVHIEMIDDSQGINYTSGLAANYSELMNCIADLLKTSQKALEGMHSVPGTNSSEIEYNVADVIGVAIKLLPFSEMQFIDKAVFILNKTDNNQ
jgi:hypothetical protein